MDSILRELQTLFSTLAAAGATALCVYLFSWLRTYLGIIESDSNEEEIRRAAATEAGLLIKLDALDNPEKLAAAAAKIIADLPKEVRAEGYTPTDVKDMILGAAGMVFPPANLLKLLK